VTGDAALSRRPARGFDPAACTSWRQWRKRQPSRASAKARSESGDRGAQRVRRGGSSRRVGPRRSPSRVWFGGSYNGSSTAFVTSPARRVMARRRRRKTIDAAPPRLRVGRSERVSAAPARTEVPSRRCIDLHLFAPIIRMPALTGGVVLDVNELAQVMPTFRAAVVHSAYNRERGPRTCAGSGALLDAEDEEPRAASGPRSSQR